MINKVDIKNINTNRLIDKIEENNMLCIETGVAITVIVEKLMEQPGFNKSQFIKSINNILTKTPEECRQIRRILNCFVKPPKAKALPAKKATQRLPAVKSRN